VLGNSLIIFEITRCEMWWGDENSVRPTSIQEPPEYALVPVNYNNYARLQTPSFGEIPGKFQVNDVTTASSSKFSTVVNDVKSGSYAWVVALVAVVAVILSVSYIFFFHKWVFWGTTLAAVFILILAIWFRAAQAHAKADLRPMPEMA